jgi:hypothetical protein
MASLPPLVEDSLLAPDLHDRDGRGYKSVVLSLHSSLEFGDR